MSEKLERRKLRILLIDGGGAKGVVPLAILNELLGSEKASNVFELIVGTSIGGIIGVMLANDLHPVDLMERIVTLCTVVFGARHPGLTESFFGLCATVGLYNHGILRDKLRETLSRGAISDLARFGELFTSAYVVTTELYRPGWRRLLFGRPQGFSLLFCQIPGRIIGRKPSTPPVVPDRHQEDEVVGRNYRNDTAVIDAMRCTSAAPTFFKSVWDGGSGMIRYIDGGVGNNHPGRVALARDFLDIGQDVDVVIVSIGCGFTEDQTPIWNVAERIKNRWTDTEIINGQVQEICRQRHFQYFRFNPSFAENEELKNLKMDCSNQVLLENAIRITQDWCGQEAERLQAARQALV